MWELHKLYAFVLLLKMTAWQCNHFSKTLNTKVLTLLSLVLACGRWLRSKRSWRSPRGSGPTCQMTSVPRTSSQSQMRNSAGIATQRAGEGFFITPEKSLCSLVINFFCLPGIKITTLCPQINTLSVSTMVSAYMENHYISSEALIPRGLRSFQHLLSPLRCAEYHRAIQ